MPMRRCLALAFTIAIALVTPAAPAQQGVHDHDHGSGETIEAPEPLPAVLRAVEAPYLTDDERRELRVFHGLWNGSDLASVPLRARAALVAGVYDDPSLADPQADAADRAEAALRRGELSEALELLTGRQEFRARRIRAEALEGLGRFEEADAAVQPIVEHLQRSQTASAEELTEGVRALTIRARLRGQPARDYENMIRLTSKAHQELDRLYWPAVLAEAELLYDKSNRAEARQALIQVLRMNPTCARAWALLGRLSVGQFDFDLSEQIADQLHRIAWRLDEDATSVDAELLLALAWMTQNQPDMGREHVEGVLDVFPRHRRALAVRAAADAMRYDFEAVEERLAAFDELSPGSPQALYEVGMALSRNRQYGPAAEYLERAIERQPQWPQPIVALGLLEMQSGRDAQALRALTRAVELDPFNRQARNSLTLLEELLTYETVESENFIVRYRPGEDEILAREMLGPMEENHRLIAEAYGHVPDRKTVIELMPDHEWFAVRITGMPNIHTIAACTGPVIAMEAPREGIEHYGEYDWVRTMRHEYVHTITLSLTKNRIPHWFTEAAAVYHERAPRDYRRVRMLADSVRNGTLFDMDEVNIAFVRPAQPGDRSKAYAQSHWMYEFILERWGADAPLELMARYAAGYREPAAFQEVLGVTQEAFSEAFAAWAAEQVASWGMAPAVTIDDLRLAELLADPPSRTGAAESVADQAARAGRAITDAMAGLGVRSTEPVRVGLPPVTGDMIDYWSVAHPDHPDVLEMSIRREIALAGGKATPSMIAQLERYAAVRPVDDMPRRELARLYLSMDDPAEQAKVIPHLEYLDAREVYSTAYAVELARQYAAIGEWSLAAARADRATQVAPYDPSHRELAARMALKAGDLEAGRRHIAALVVLEPQHEPHKRRLERIEEILEQG